MSAKSQAGYSLIEMLIALVITALVGGVLVTSINQFTVISRQGTTRLTALDEVQNAAWWVIRDAQSAVLAGTQAGCTSNCTYLELTVPNPSGTVTYTPPNPALGQVFGTLSYESDTITFYKDGENFCRSINGGGGYTIAKSITVTFTTTTIPGTRNRHFVTVDMTAPIDGGDDVVQQFHTYLRATGE